LSLNSVPSTLSSGPSKISDVASADRIFDREAGERHFALLDLVPSGHFILRRDFVVLYWNRSLEQWTGIAREQIVGICIFVHFPHLAEPKYATRIEGVFAGGPPAVFSSQLHRHIIPAALPGGKMRFQYTVVNSVPAPDGGDCYAMFAIQDVTSLTEAIENHGLALNRAMQEMEERRKVEAELVKHAAELKRLNRILKERSIRDGLTALYNHRHFYKVLRRDFLLSLRNESDLSCLLLDIDHFKAFNDTYGHRCGDAILKEIARLLNRAVRKTDVVARYGGEEFALLLPHTSVEGARTLAENIRSLVEKHSFSNERRSLSVTISIGIATRLLHRPEKPHELLAAADQALYHAKNTGRNRVAVAFPDENANLPATLP
jgi:diguanylate cyclase (GGDEF)-like protein/PAS domain S-box-containing protein